MKKIISVFLLLTIVGCASTTIPNYIHDDNPYKRVYYAPFQTVWDDVMKTLEERGWAVEKESEPALFERVQDIDADRQQTLIFTDVRQTSFFVGSRYTRMNAYIRELGANETEVEIRYLTVTSTLFKNFYGYKNDREVNHIFDGIEQKLNNQK